MKTVKRKKAFIGAIIQTAQNVIGGIVNAAQQRKEAERQQRIEDANNTVSRNQALMQQYNNQKYVDDFRKKQTLKMGGQFTDRNKQNKRRSKATCGTMKKYACGGRKKAEMGLGAAAALTALTGVKEFAGLANKTVTPQPQQFGYTAPKERLNTPTTNVTDDTQQTSTYRHGATYKCGGKKVMKRRK